jgi:hypothetical protein
MKTSSFVKRCDNISLYIIRSCVELVQNFVIIELDSRMVEIFTIPGHKPQVNL